MKAPVKVLIVEDSLPQMLLLESVINSDPRLSVVASASTAEEAIRLLSRVRPDVVSMDLHLPRMNGYEATIQIMRTHPMPIVVVSTSVSSRETEISMNSLKAGALAVVQKPPGPSYPEHRELSSKLCDQLVIMSDVKVVRQRGGNGVSRVKRRGPVPLRTSPRMVGIVASTGGPPALASLLAPLPVDYPLPILLVQHMTEAFLGGFVDWLDGLLDLKVIPAVDGLIPLPGHVYVAPSGSHLVLREGRLRLDPGDPVDYQRPSGTLLFQSMAAALRDEAVGILLTGMGSDGAEGLLALKNQGAYTVAEDCSTATVYGMPRAAVDLEAAVEVLALDEIGDRLVALGKEVIL